MLTFSWFSYWKFNFFKCPICTVIFFFLFLCICLITHPKHRDKETVKHHLWEASLISAQCYKSCLFALWLSWKSYVSFPMENEAGSLHREQPLRTSWDNLDRGTVIPPSWQQSFGKVCPSHLIKHCCASEHGAWIFSSFSWLCSFK